jgi:hypothetical protein
MDMKKILQAMDGASKAPVRADDEMKRFVSIISEGRGSSNRPTQAEQLVTQHYTKFEQPVVEKKSSTSIDKYFKLVEQELTESLKKQQTEKEIKIQRLAERAVKEVGGNYGHFSKIKSHLSRAKNPPENIMQMAKDGAKISSKRIHVESDEIDTVTMDIPLFMRLLEYAKEDAKTDMDLHHLVEKAIELSKEDTLSMDHYDSLVGDQKLLPDEVDENLRTDNPCWKGYKPVGTKKKNGKTVPNCVPKK